MHRPWPGIVEGERVLDLAELTVLSHIVAGFVSFGSEKSDSVAHVVGIFFITCDFCGVEQGIVHYAPFITCQAVGTLVYNAVGHLSGSHFIDISEHSVDVGLHGVG